MPEIVFKGKEFVYNHHLSVPYRPLVAHPDKGIGAPDLGGNLIIHGDNLAALKSLMPRYAGKVDLIFIDPPYNTGNEGWCYSDNLSSPIMKEWLSSNPVDADDLLRHDKWLCMMWPRLTLLRELLSEHGSIWMTLDDNEVHRARMVMDEIFGDESFLANIVWQKKYSPQNDAEHFSPSHDHLLVYCKSKADVSLNLLARTEAQDSAYRNQDADARGPWKASDLTRAEHRDRDFYSLRTPSGRDVFPAKGRSWSRPPDEIERLQQDNRLWFGKDGSSIPSLKRFLSEVQRGVVPQTIWFRAEVGDNQEAKQNLKQMFEEIPFATPKPVQLIERVLQIGAQENSLILDSFAGSGTTAHAVLKANAKDGGNRRFVLIEGEPYADTLTAERVRRAIHGYAWQGTQRETLLAQKLSFSHLKKADGLLAQVEAIKAREGFSVGDLADQGNAATQRFDSIDAKLDDGVLRVEGVRRISEYAPGLGGRFTYCTLGELLDLEKMLSGKRLPSAAALGEWLFHTATGGSLTAAPKDAPTWYLGEAQDRHVWLVYEPDLIFLKGPQAALTLSLAQRIAQWGTEADTLAHQRKGHLVFAPAKYLSNQQLRQYGVDFAPLPFALYREG